MSKLIFLDIDGVCNNVPSHRTPGTLNRKWLLRTAPECMAVLDWLMAESGAQIVVSSSNRCGREPAAWRECFTELGVPSARFVGETPRLEPRPERGHEIDSWLKENGSPSNFVIIDDDDDMAMHSHRLVRTDFHRGLTMDDARRVVSMLA